METGREALHYEQIGDGRVVCGLCRHRCRIARGQRGRCGVRENQAGRLISLVYGRLVAQTADPIEKKPLFHVLPGSRTWSIATVGCNFRCLHCQNHQISQYPHTHHGAIAGERRSAAEVVEDAVRHGCASISATYVEPTIFFEFTLDYARMARHRGLRNIVVSNGFMTEAAARQIAPVLDAINIDLKAFSDDFYQQICGARLSPVLENIRLLHGLGVWVEVTTLIIPGLNDSEEELRAIARFLVSVSVDLPWHVSAFRPAYRLTDRPPTPAATVDRARAIGRAEGLRYVYGGNVASSGGGDTLCPGCGGLLIERHGFRSRIQGLERGRCASCGQVIAGVWD